MPPDKMQFKGNREREGTGRSPCRLAGHPGRCKSPREGAHARFRETQYGRSVEDVVSEAPCAGEPGGRSGGRLEGPAGWSSPVVRIQWVCPVWTGEAWGCRSQPFPETLSSAG